MSEIVRLTRGVTRPLLALLLVGAVITLALRSEPIPDALLTLAATAVGYWFGQHVLAKDG